MPPAPLYFRFRRFPEKIIDRKSLKSIFWQYLRVLGPFPIWFLTIPNNFRKYVFVWKNVYLTLIRSPLWSLVKPEKNMLDPIFDFWNLPGPWRGSLPCGEPLCPVESLLPLWRAHCLCEEPIASVESPLPLWRAYCLCGEPIPPVESLFTLWRAYSPF